MFLISASIMAQDNFETSFGFANTSDIAKDVVATADGGYVLVGTSNTPEMGYQVYALKIDATGTEVWSQLYGSEMDEFGMVVSLDAEENLYLAGHRGLETEGGDVWAMKVSGEDGSIVWQNVYEEADLEVVLTDAVVALDDDGLILLGNKRDIGTEGNRPFMTKIGTDGTQVWDKFVFENENITSQRVETLTKTPSGFYMLGGYTLDNQFSNAQPKIWKMTDEGDLLAERLLNITDGTDFPYFIAVYDILIDENSDMYMVGGSKSDNAFTTGPSFVLKTDSSGNEIWRNIDEFTSFSSQNRVYNKVIRNENNELIAVGMGINESSNSDLSVIKLDQNGTLIASNLQDIGTGIDELWSVALNGENTIVIGRSSGMNDAMNNGYDILVADLNTDLEVENIKNFGTVGPHHGHSTLAFCLTESGDFLIPSSANATQDQHAIIRLFQANAQGELVNSFDLDTDNLSVPYDILNANDGNYILQSTSSAGINITKIDETGNIIWDTPLNTRPIFQKAVAATDGGYYFGGYSQDANVYWGLLGEDGNMLWNVEHVVDNATASNVYDILENSAGELIVSGRVNNSTNESNGNIGTRPLVIKSSNTGEVLWETVYFDEDETESGTFGRIIKTIQTSDGDYVTIGTTGNVPLDQMDMHIMKIRDVDGTILWEKSYIVDKGFGSYDVMETEDGSLIFLGNSLNLVDSPVRQGVLLKTDASGNEIWTKYYETAGDRPLFYDFLELPNGDYGITGLTGINNTSVVLLMTVNEEGEMVATNIEELNITEKIQVAPNPNKGAFMLSFENEMKGEINIQVFDMNGRLCHSVKDYKNQNIYTQNFEVNLSSGMYFCQISDGQKTLTKKINIQ